MLEKDGYKGAINGTIKIKTPIDPNGNIIVDGEGIPKGTKTITITRANANNSADDNYAVVNSLLDIVTAETLRQTNTFTVKWEVY